MRDVFMRGVISVRGMSYHEMEASPEGDRTAVNRLAWRNGSNVVIYVASYTLASVYILINAN